MRVMKHNFWSSHKGENTKILHLTLKKKWFDMIFSGNKKEEYREIKPYWLKRLCYGICGSQYIFREYDLIEFRNGYSRDAQTILVEFKGVKVKTGRMKWGAEKGVKYFCIQLGNIVDEKNIKP